MAKVAKVQYSILEFTANQHHEILSVYLRSRPKYFLSRSK
jgi:hypothetical protein